MTKIKQEDRSFGGNKPYIDLLPANQWGSMEAIINSIGKDAWVTIESYVARRVNHSCELCGASETVQGVMGRRANKFCVEMRYEHDETSKVATLRRLLHICVSCRQAIHLRKTELAGKNMPVGRSPFIGAVARLAKFHALTESDVRNWLSKEVKKFEMRANANYPENLDIDIIEDGLNRLWR